MAKRDLTTKQQIILLLIYTFRFLHRKQIQEFLRHKDHRRINSWLKELVESGYLERDFTVVYGVLTKPAVYYLSRRGRAYIKQVLPYASPLYMQRLARDRTLSPSFKIRCQIVADWYLQLFFPIEKTDELQHMQHPKNKLSHDSTGIPLLDVIVAQLSWEDVDDVIPFQGFQFFTPAYFPSFSLLPRLKPDAYLRARTRRGIQHGVLFVLDMYVPRFFLRYMLSKIFDALYEEAWEDASIASFTIYFICPNHVVCTYLRRILQSKLERYYGAKELIVHLITRNQLAIEKKDPRQKARWVHLSSKDSFT